MSIAKSKVPKGLREWVHTAVDPADIESLYRAGFAGAIHDQDARDFLLSEMEEPNGELVANQYGFANGTQEGLVLLFLPTQKAWNVWPKPAQTTGNCVAKAGSNIGLIDIGMDVESKQPDEKTGFLEGFPVLSETAIRNGAVADEPAYGDRGHRGQGANCDTLIRCYTKTQGVILRKNYEGVIDLEKTNTNISIGWGGSGTPQAVRDLGKDHQIRIATACTNWQNGKDFVFRGYPLWSCSGLGWESKRDEWGFSRMTTSWGHSWVVGGWDSRPETVKRYGFELFLYIHDWGKWNSGPRQIHGTNEEIPEGCFWADARLLDRCDITALASVAGWGQRTIPKVLPGVFHG